MEIRRPRVLLFAVVLIVMMTVVLFQANSILTALGGLHR
jgi:hypothetical protein